MGDNSMPCSRPACHKVLTQPYQPFPIAADEQWMEEHSRALESHRWLSQSELLRLDAEILQVQLNIRLLLEVRQAYERQGTPV
mgnify:CR=1 FL=1